MSPSEPGLEAVNGHHAAEKPADGAAISKKQIKGTFAIPAWVLLVLLEDSISQCQALGISASFSSAKGASSIACKLSKALGHHLGSAIGAGLTTPLQQTDPPSIPVADLFSGRPFPEGERQAYTDEYVTCLMCSHGPTSAIWPPGPGTAGVP